MNKQSSKIQDISIIQRQDLQKLFDVLNKNGYQVLGPTVRDSAIIYDELGSVEDLPIGWTDEQNGGTYRIKKRKDQALFGYVVGPHSWKKFLFPSLVQLWQAKRNEKDFKVASYKEEVPKYAFFGVRSCEIHALAIQDNIFASEKYTDPLYQSRRKNIFIVAVNCGQAGGTCFCASMKTGPKASSGFDLALTEVVDGERHYFVVEVGTSLGEEILNKVPHSKAGENELRIAEQISEKAEGQMGRVMDTTEIKELLYRNYEHSHWDEVAQRCLTCTNCTMACPTCFCNTVEDVTDLTGAQAARKRRWDSCFNLDFSYIHGGSIRSSAKSRYRQWIVHKLAAWHDQFGTSGCVGCGRCITWCPVGIDITEEVQSIRKSEKDLSGKEAKK